MACRYTHVGITILKLHRYVTVVCHFVVAPPLSMNIVADSLESLTHRWQDVGSSDLHIPYTVLDSIQSEHSSNAEQLQASVRYWLLHDPLASWRRLVHQLDGWSEKDFRTVVDGIRNNAEKLQGQQQ